MKTYDFPLDEYLITHLFTAIRDKTDVIRLLMNAVKAMLVNRQVSTEKTVGRLVLHVDKMSRLFLISDVKIFSVNFPFQTAFADGTFCFSAKMVEEIDHKVTSEVLSVLGPEGTFSSPDALEFIEPIVEIEDFSIGFWSLMRELLTFEDGYVRFDHDPDREDGRRHPLNHIDVFYSPSSTFKIGLKDKVALEYLLDLINIRSDCHFLTTD